MKVYSKESLLRAEEMGKILGIFVGGCRLMFVAFGQI